MISGIKISQLPVIDTFTDIDYLPVARGGDGTFRVSGRQIVSEVSNYTKDALFLDYNLDSNTFTLTSDKTVFYTDNFTVSGGTQIIETNSTVPALRVTQAGSGHALVIEDSETTDSTPFVVTSSGNVGIGISYPENKLTVAGNISATGDLYTATGKLINNAGSSVNYVEITPINTLHVVLSNTEKLTILNDGKVGIGTSAPNTPLTVIGSISANTVYADFNGNVSGNASTASKWEETRRFELSGAVYGHSFLDGSLNTTITTVLSQGVVSNTNISPTANITDDKLAAIQTKGKVNPLAISAGAPSQVLMTVSGETSWQTISASDIVFPSGSITENLLADGSITSEKIVADAITTNNLSGALITEAKIADNAVTTAKIQSGAVMPANAYAYAQNIPNSFVLRDDNGNLSAAEITADINGNAKTATSWKTPTQFRLEGDVTGSATFDGSENQITINTTVPRSDSVWAVYGATSLDNLTATYIQGETDPATPSNTITLSFPEYSLETVLSGGFFEQVGNTVVVYLTSYFETDILSEYVDNNFNNYLGEDGPFILSALSTSDVLSANGSPGTNLIEQEYDVQDVTVGSSPGQWNFIAIELSSSVTQDVTGNIDISYIEVTLLDSPPSYTPNHILNVEFLSGAAFDGGSFTLPVSGLYRVQENIDSYTYTLSTNVTQAVSGQAIIHQCKLKDGFGITAVTYVDVGQHIVLFERAFQDIHHYAVVGSGMHPSLSDTLYMSSLEKPFRLNNYLSDELNCEVNSMLNDGTIKYYDFDRTSAIFYGSL